MLRRAPRTLSAGGGAHKQCSVVAAPKKVDERLRKPVKTLAQIGAADDVAMLDPTPDRRIGLIISGSKIADDEAPHQDTAVYELHHVTRTGRRLARVIGGDLAAQ